MKKWQQQLQQRSRVAVEVEKGREEEGREIGQDEGEQGGAGKMAR